MLFFIALISGTAAAQPVSVETIDDGRNAKICSEGMDRSQVIGITHYLADVYGPRPIGSPNYISAANWAVKFGSAEEPTKDFNKLFAYWKLDDGTGRVRGGSVFGPPEAATVVAQLVKPFEDYGIYGAAASTARGEGSSDNGAFAVAGLPGIGTQHDNIEYKSVAHKPRHPQAHRAGRCHAQLDCVGVGDVASRES